MSFGSLSYFQNSQFGSAHSRVYGLGLIDVIVGVAILTTLFFGIYGMFQTGLEVIFNSKAKSGAVALLEGKMEQVRSLPYAAVGTEGGIVAGNLAQTEEVTLNSIDYTRRIVVGNYDSPADGSGVNDENGVTNDFKRVKIAVSWIENNDRNEVTATTYIVPNGLETDGGGGTLSFQIFDAIGEPVENAEITIINEGTEPAIDTTTYTDSAGRRQLSGVPTSSQYEISVTKDGYSSAGTYSVTQQNQRPDPGHLTVALSDVTTASFAIDEVSSLRVNTVTPQTQATFTAPFTDLSSVASSSDIAIENQSLALTQSSGVYASSGVAYTEDITSTSTISEWGELDFTAQTAAGTDFRVSVVTSNESTSEYARLPDDELSGNETGFSNPPIDLSSIATSSYQSLAFRIQLETNAPTVTPQIEELSVSYQVGGEPKPNVPFVARGNKTVGVRADETPVYKYRTTSTTGADGVAELSSLEWDTYELRLPQSDTLRIAKSCPPQPISLAPATSTDIELSIAEASGNSLLVTVLQPDGSVADNASVTLASSAENVKRTGVCGQVFFQDLAAGSYEVSAGSADTATTTETISVEGAAQVTFNLESQ